MGTDVLNQPDLDTPYPPFEHCRLTTMTLVFILEGSVCLEPAFSLLPIKRMAFTPPKRQKKKFELPHCKEQPGAILSMRFSGDTRGIIRSTSGRFFKNSITIDLSTREKNVSIKLSKSKIQMCGASSEQQGREGAQHLIDHLLAIQDDLDYVQNKMQTPAGVSVSPAEETLEWLIKKTRGSPTQRDVYILETRLVQDENGEEVEVKEPVFSHTEPDHKIITPQDLSDAPDRRVAEFLVRHYADFDYHSFFVSEMKWMLTVEQIATRPLSIKKILKAMVNYNYELGFIVDRYNLYEEMLDRNGFVSSYDNCVEHCVKIKLPYIPDEDEGVVRRKNKIPCHCFLVYRSGVVTQTGPGEEKMREAYNLFWKSILEIKDRIILEETPPPSNRRVIIRRRQQCVKEPKVAG